MSEAEPEIGTRFGPYLLKRQLGSGGMGTVYEAQDTVMDRVVALKLISGPYAQDPAYRQRLQREARIAGRLQEPHVVPIHSTGEIDGQLYVDMRLINGTDLESILQRSGPLPAARAVAIVRQIASALDAAHAVGVLHRDVKPANILITADDFAYLVDFGIANAVTEAKLTQMGDVVGTWTYMAPERFRGDEGQVTPSADTYSLGCVLIEALTGVPPFPGDTASVIGGHLTEAPPRVGSRMGLPPMLDDVIARAMAKDPGQRYATTGEFARAAEEALTGLVSATAAFTVPAGPAPTIPAPTPPPTPAPTVPGWADHQPPAPQWSQAPTAQYVPPAAGGPGGPQTAGPQPAPKGKRTPWLLIAGAVVLVVAVVAGVLIWQLTKEDSKRASGPNISNLDVGHYNTKPRPLPGPATPDEGRYLESYRLAEGAVDPYTVDHILDHVYGNAVPNPAQAATSISGTGMPLTQPVLEKYGMISAYLIEGLNTGILDFLHNGKGDLLRVLLTSFPNDDAASRAAAEMDSLDFGVSPENRTTPIPGYPQARAHYRPDSPSVGATMASGRLVFSIAVRSDDNANLPYLTTRIQHTLDVQVPLAAKLIPDVAADLTALPLDPDHMLSRIFVEGDQPKVSADFGSMGPHAAVFCADSQSRKDGLFSQAGIDRCAVTVGGTLLRAKDETAAKTILPKLFAAERNEFIDHDVQSPAGLPDARCYEQKQELVADSPNSRFECLLSFGRYVAAVRSGEEADVRQRAAAQYSILVNSA